MNEDPDVESILTSWISTDPPENFSSRVLAALPVAAPSRPWRPWLVAAMVCISVFVVAVIFYGTRETVSRSVLAAAQDTDLGMQRD